jgi:4-amino-4-deoxy-L-arabinose transferase-like glycosyltransferase
MTAFWNVTPNRRDRLTSAVVCIVVWATVAWVVVFWGLGDFSLLDPDEAHYAELTREMVRTHRWLVPLFDGAPYIDKPVLFHWLQTAAIWVFGDTELALRLPSACAAVGLFGMVRWMGAQLFDARTGNRAALMFATLPLTFVLSSVAVFDMVFTAFLFGAMACLLIAALRNRPRLEYAGWSLLTLAVMTKGPVALALVLMFGVALSVRRTTRAVVTRLQWKGGLAFVFVAASPWFLYMWVTYRAQFVRDYVLAGNVWYVTAPLAFTTRRSDPLFYVRTFAGALFPWSLIAVGRAADAWALRRRQTVAIEENALWTWLVVVLAFFTAARFKLDTYIFPVAPALALIAAYGWQQAQQAAVISDTTSWTRRACGLIAVLFVVGGIVSSVVLFRIDLELPGPAVLLPASLMAGGLALGLQLRLASRGRPSSSAVIVVTLLCVYACVVVFGLPVLERSRPTAPIGRWLSRHSPADTPVGVVGLDDWTASIRYYADRRLVRLNGPDDLNDFLAQYPNAYVLMLRRDYLAARTQGAAIRQIGGRRAIVGRAGKYIRRQIWGRIVVARRVDGGLLAAATEGDVDLPDP